MGEMNHYPGSPPIKILLINVHSVQNKGDAALLKMAIKNLRSAFPQCSITIAVNDPDSLSELGGESKVGSLIYWMHRASASGEMRWRYLDMVKMLLASIWALITYRLIGRPYLWGLQGAQKDTLRAYFESDMVVSAPGNFLYSSGRLGATFLLVAYTMGYAILAGKPLYLFPQSIGPLRRKRDQKLARWILNRARVVMVREPISLEEVRRVGISNPRCYLVPDLAFAFQSAPREEAMEHLRALGVDVERERPLLGVTVINWGARVRNDEVQSRYEESLGTVTRYYLDNFGGKVLYFSHVRSRATINDDRIPTRRIVERLGETQRVVLVEEAFSPELLKAMYGLMDIFIGTRMHSNIFALSQGVPVIAIAYFHKTKGIMQMLGLEEWVIDIEAITPELLINKLIKLWQEKDKIRQLIQEKLILLAKDTNLASLYIASDFVSLRGRAQ